jgi:hypothetical protein
MNAHRAIWFPLQQRHFTRTIQNRHRLSSVSSEDASREIVMARFQTRPEITRLAITRLEITRLAFAVATPLAGSLWVSAACASQGPGGGPGSASSFTQLMMATIVYGSAAAVIGAGLIGAARRPRGSPIRNRLSED